MIILYMSLMDNQSDRELFESMYIKYRLPMLHIAMSILKDQDLAQDAVHNAFLRIAKYMHRLDLTRDPGALMLTITRNCALTMTRDRRNEHPIDDIPTEEISCHGQTLEEHCENRSKIEKIGEYISRLPEEYSTIFILRFRHQFRTKEIAELLGISDDAVRKRISRMKRDIQLMFDKEE